MTHVHPVSIYYEDTDHSGIVYHANYLKYCERAREHLLGRDRLVSMYRDQGTGFVVYKAEMTFKEGAVFGDELEVRTTAELASEYRLLFHQPIFRKRDDQLMVDVTIHLVAVGADNKLVRLPEDVLALAQ
ncbi:MAG: YbgC/FadM family acyl-CoA thioesterase [Myxococcota bacterium]